MDPPSETIRVVHVDDEPDFAELCATFLSRVDPRMTVTTATEPGEALAHLDVHDVDCIVSDHDMGARTGIEFLETVRETYPTLPFILFTGKGTEEVASRAISAGVTDYIQKEGGTEQFTVLANRIANAVDQYESDRQFRTLAENLPGVVYRMRNRREWTDDFVLGEVETLTGYTAAEFDAQDVTFGEVIIHPSDRDQIWEEVQTRLDADEPFELTYRIITKGGEVKWVWERGQRVGTGSDGEAVLEGFITEISRQKRREWKLERLQERSRDLTYTRTVEETAQLAVDAADGIIDAPLSGIHLLAEDETRLEPAAVAGSVPDMFETRPAYDRDAPAGSRAALVWETFEDGEPIHLEDVAASSRLTEGSPAGSVVLHPIGDHGVFIISAPEREAFTETDVLLVEILANNLEAALDRVDREETLRGREHRLKQLHHATRGLIEANSQDAIAELVSEAAEETLGFSVTVVRLYDPEAEGLVPVAASDAVANVLPERDTFTGGDGSLNWAAYETGEVRVYDDIEAVGDAVDHGTGLRSLMILPMGKYGTVSVGDLSPGGFDATDEFLARILATAAETALQAEERERELREKRDEFKRQNDRLETFASFVSHDLQNPLSVATGRLELASEECDSDHLESVDRAHSRMENLIDGFLTFARAGEAALDPEPVAVGPLAADVWDTVATDGASLHIKDDRQIRADRDRLRQLLENLIGNAVTHGVADNGAEDDEAIGDEAEGDGAEDDEAIGDEAEGDGAVDDSLITVTVRVNEDGFIVEDDGVGIPEGERDAVFDAGYSSSRNGTGFGLAVVKQIADSHGWDVRVTNGNAGGARFELTGVEVVDPDDRAVNKS